MAITNGVIYMIAESSRLALDEPAKEMPAVHC